MVLLGLCKNKVPENFVFLELDFDLTLSVFDFLSYSKPANIEVLRYFSALSGKTTTMLPLSILQAVRTAASMAAPLLIPANIASSDMILRAMVMASSLSIISWISICDGSYMAGTMASSMFFSPWI